MGVAGQEMVTAAYVFGSFIKTGDFHDIDVALLLLEDLPPYQRVKFALRLAGELERSMKPRREFDVKILNSSPVYFQYEVVRTGVLVFERDREARAVYESHLISDYLDKKEMYDFLDREFLARA